MTSFEEALTIAQYLVAKGDARQYATGRSPEVGRFIDVETTQGWPPGHFWQEREVEA